MDVFIDFVNWLLENIADGLVWIMDLLPKSPFADWRTDPPEEIDLGYITWFIPFPTMMVHFAGFLLALGIYYLYRVAARWMKLVRS